MRQIKINTNKLEPGQEDFLWLALKVGDVRLREIGVDLHIVSDEVVHCDDGMVFDRFPWPHDITLGLLDGGIRITALESNVFDGTVAEHIGQKQLEDMGHPS